MPIMRKNSDGGRELKSEENWFVILLKYKKYKDIKLLQCIPKYSEAQIDFNKMLFTLF